MPIKPKHLAGLAISALAALACAGPSFADEAARVLSVEGVSVVQRAGAQPRILGAADTLTGEDVINVGPSSHAIIEFTDHTQITLRPGTVFRVDALSSGNLEALLKGLIKGGMRGAAFDARWCEEDCLKEEQRKPVTRAKPAARVVDMKGTVAARSGDNARLLVPGAAVYERDGVATGAKSYAVLVFSDGSRISLAADSRLSVSSFQFDYARHTGSAVVIHHAGEAMVATGKIAKQGPSFYRLITPLGEVKPLGTLIQSVAGGVQQAADQGADAARETGEKVVGAVQDTAGQAAQTALNAAITPILNTMSELMTRLRDNPPTTEAGWNDLKSQMTRTSDRLHEALDEAIRVGGAAADSREFKTAVGLALAAELQVVAVGASINNENGMGGDFMGPAAYATLVAMVAGAKASTYQSESLALVGLSHADLDRVSSNRWAAHTIIAAEVGGYLASQGSTAARNFFSKAEAAAEELRQRTQQAEQAAAQAAAEAEQRAIEDAQRLAEEARAAELEAERLAAEGKAKVEQAGKENAANPKTPVPGLGAAPLPMLNPPPAGIQENVQEGADSAAQAGRDVLGKISDAGEAGVGEVGAQSEKALRAIEDIRAAEREFARRVADLKNALNGMSNLSETEKQSVRDTLDEWSRLVGEEVARLTAEAMKNPNAQVVLTSLKIMAIVVATVATVIVAGAVMIPLAVLSAVAHTAMTNPSVFDGLPASTIAQATRGADESSEAMRGILSAMVEHGKLGADEARRFLEAMGQDTVDRANTANAQLQNLLQELNNLESMDKRLDEGKTQDSRNGGNQTGSSNTTPAEPASPAQVTVWDGSVEIAGRIVRKGEALRAASGGQLESGPNSGVPVTNAPRPDLVKIDPRLFEDWSEIVGGRQSREAEGSSDNGSRKGKGTSGSDDERKETLKHERKDPKNASGSADSEPDPKGGGDSQGGARKDPRQATSNTEDEPDPRGGGESSSGGGVRDSRPPSNDGEEEPDPMAERAARRREPTERGLYVWARDGVIKLNRGGKAVEVAAGNAIAVTKDQIAQLDYVPNFMRFDRTPRPDGPGRAFVPPPFVMTDGSVAGNCVAK